MNAPAPAPAGPAPDHPCAAVAAAEQAKWDDFYEGFGEAGESAGVKAFHEELVRSVGGLLPPGAEVLEAGCGAGLQSLALARDGGFRVSLLDISPNALGVARNLLERNGVAADARVGDVFAAGEPAFDLVFNAGVLEHYTLPQQAAFLRGMASRSRRFVLALVPNRQCYWYWLWRVCSARYGNWPFGKECPTADLSAAFEAAGLRFLGQTFLGAEWTADHIRSMGGLSDDLRHDLLEIHRSPLLPAGQRCYLMAALGSVRADEPRPAGWLPPAAAEGAHEPELAAALADALALHLAGLARIRQAEHAARAAEENQRAAEENHRAAEENHRAMQRTMQGWLDARAEEVRKLLARVTDVEAENTRLHARVTDVEAENAGHRTFLAGRAGRLALLLQRVRGMARLRPRVSA